MIPNDITPTTELVKQTTDAVSVPKEKKVRRYTVSKKVFSANRRNTLRSTGPQTARGKEASRMNAVKHGILSGAVVVRGLRIQEQEGEFKMLREQCWECLAPVGRIEEMLVDRIVTTQWRLRRVMMAETGEIVLSVDAGLRQRENGLPVALKSAEGLDYLGNILRRVREGMAKDGWLTREMCKWVQSRFGGQPNAVTKALWEYWEKFGVDMGAIAPDALEEREKVKERHRTAVERYIELKLMDCAEFRRESMRREDTEETAQQAANVLPESQVLDKILRYESALERQLYRALNQLERIQRRRGGENVPPPVTVSLSRG